MKIVISEAKLTMIHSHLPVHTERVSFMEVAMQPQADKSHISHILHTDPLTKNLNK